MTPRAPRVNVKMALAKPPLPAPVPTGLGARRHTAVTRSHCRRTSAYVDRGARRHISPSPVTSPQPTPPEPLAVNVSESAPRPAQERIAQSSVRYPLSDRARVRRSERVPGERPGNAMPKFEDVSGPRDATQEFQMYNGVVKSGSLREDPRPVRPRDGYRDGSPRGNAIPAEFGDDNRARPVSLTGEHCESPP